MLTDFAEDLLEDPLVLQLALDPANVQLKAGEGLALAAVAGGHLDLVLPHLVLRPVHADSRMGPLAKIHGQLVFRARAGAQSPAAAAAGAGAGGLGL